MGKAIDLTGRTFGSLYVISKADSKTYTYSNGKCTVAYWNCRCSGGGRLCKGAKMNPVTSGHLLSGHTISCGCKRAFKSTSPVTWLYGSYRGKAKVAHRSFEISKEAFASLVSQNCDYCGRPPSQKVTSVLPAHPEFVYNGIDRIDNAKGYVDGNVVPCCGPCNDMKCDKSREEFLRLIAAVYHHTHDLPESNVHLCGPEFAVNKE
jgi:hypothetical protein